MENDKDFETTSVASNKPTNQTKNDKDFETTSVASNEPTNQTKTKAIALVSSESECKHSWQLLQNKTTIGKQEMKIMHDKTATFTKQKNGLERMVKRWQGWLNMDGIYTEKQKELLDYGHKESSWMKDYNPQLPLYTKLQAC